MNNILTCVYCGHAYPEGTPPHGSQVLTDHIRVCEKHPLRKAEADIVKLREALFGICDERDPNVLREMKVALALMPHPAQSATMKAIDALLETEPVK